MNKNILTIGITVLFIISVVTPIVIGYNIEAVKEDIMIEKTNFDKSLLYEYYNYYSVDEIPDFIQHRDSKESNIYDNIETEKISKLEETMQPLDGPPIDSPWPMYCHDTRHTSRSPYSTASNPSIEKWRFPLDEVVTGGIAIDNDETIYFGSDGLYAVYPNGTLKWKYITHFKVVHTPAIDEDGTIYFGFIYGDNHLFALYPNGTLKWKFWVGESIFSSPAIGDDGTIYFGDADHRINAIYPNGTLKWRYKTGHVVYSSPAIGEDGTIYCGSHDGYLYALYPNNGTLKWRYKTGHWVRVSPCIADDGTIYVVSLDDYLHALYPNGTRKWRTNVGAGTSPTIGQDGTIYAGYRKLHAVEPIDGSIKWTFNPGPDRMIRAATPCNSLDGTIYFGTHIGETSGGELIAVNPDGTEKWRKMIASDWVDSAPAISEDGTVYVGSWDDSYHSVYWGYLHAFGELGPDAPSAPIISGPTKCIPRSWNYKYTIVATSPVGRKLYYFIDWGDSHYTDWFGSFNSGEKVIVEHSFDSFPEWTNVINVQAKDTSGLLGYWGSLKVTMPRNKIAIYNSLFLKFLEQFPLLERLLALLII